MRRATSRLPSGSALIGIRSRPRPPSVSRSSREALSPWLLTQRRTFFGIGEILGVITNPSDVLKSLAESKKLLEEARQEMKENNERAQIPPMHAFAPLPGFYDRPREIQAISRALGGVPAFTVLFGASSVGKTALLRQVLSNDRFHVLHFDLRIAGFADLSSLYFSLVAQLESYFSAIPDLMGREWGWGEFEKESWAFKHDRLAMVKRLEGGGEVKISDIAHLMELFQSALLKYWEFEPMSPQERERRKQAAEEASKDSSSDPKTSSTSKSSLLPGLGMEKPIKLSKRAKDQTQSRMREGWGAPVQDLRSARTVAGQEADAESKETGKEGEEKEEVEEQPPPKKIPVFFLDEAHKLPALIQADDDAMKMVLDAMLVLTKQDRLIQIVQSTSDPFFMHWLRQLNIMQHCHILSIGDCSKSDARDYFETQLVPHIPEQLRDRIDFEELYKVFGGKLAHLNDYVSEFVNSEGEIDAKHSSHSLQAYTLLNLQLMHAMAAARGKASEGFEIYSPLKRSSSGKDELGEGSKGAEFSHLDLLRVCKVLANDPKAGQDVQTFIPYFELCRELGGVAPVDAMVRARLLELRWSDTVTEEGDSNPHTRRSSRDSAQIGPVLVPTTPVVRYAMTLAVEEYKDLLEKDGRTTTGVAEERVNR